MASDLAVSVVVPTFNSGPHLETLVASLAAQSLPRNRYEVVFVDDGSSDQTPRRLDELAATIENVRVFHEPASGWPGRPRNVGIDRAAGRYVFFSDHDDWLAPEALERMVVFADGAAADVLLPKMVGHGRGVPDEVYAENDPAATLMSRPLMTSLTPHKLFRRGFLEEHLIRFPEGRRRLEDHVFVVTAYLLARRIAILADYDCYHHVGRADQSNAGFWQSDPRDYFGNLREVIDVIDAHTEPGPQRDELLERPYRQEMLGRLARRNAFTLARADHRQSLFDEVRRLLLERFPPDFGSRCGLLLRARDAAVRDDDLGLLLDLNARADELGLRAELVAMRWAESGWVVDVALEPVVAGSGELRFLPGEGDTWHVDEQLLPASLAHRIAVTTDELLDARPVVTVIDRQSEVPWNLPGTFTAHLVPLADGSPGRRLVLRGTARLDAATAAGGRFLSAGVWDLRARVNTLGTSLVGRLLVPDAERRIPVPALIGSRPVAVIPFVTKQRSTLAIDVGQRRRTLLAAVRSEPFGALTIRAGTFEVPVHVEVAAGAAPRTLVLHLLREGAPIAELDAAIVSTPGGARLLGATTPIAGAGSVELSAGRYRVAARSRAKDDLTVIGTVDLDDSAHVVAGEFSAR